ncbi:hypothetical protein BS47DRAFT_1369285 [Hydnum rufescens UP504]|uniref:Uncharacterized protein n=1 Tax=Hydnum rufescens UP504 TaxID=1448309 RepID=A0A9P6DM09_9AGAM|nr:hypothetical protein BS47DRAFT_1369285 [Hydnum rufescens UP504]
MRRMEEVVMRRPSGHMNHTPAAAGVWLYIMLSPQIKTCGASPPASETRERRHETTPNRMNHTRYRGCVVLYKVITSATRQMKLGNDNAPTNRKPQTRNPGTGTHDARPQGPQTNHARWVCGIGFHLNPHPTNPQSRSATPLNKYARTATYPPNETRERQQVENTTPDHRNPGQTPHPLKRVWYSSKPTARTNPKPNPLPPDSKPARTVTRKPATRVRGRLCRILLL